jgi:16S rRNA (uracil1498-N3)-methyltransferase
MGRVGFDEIERRGAAVQRYFVNKDQIVNGRVTIAGDDARHIFRVLRMVPGDNVICCDGTGAAYLVVLERLTEAVVTGRILEPLAGRREAGIHITLAQGLPKGDKMDMIIQKGTEMGVSRFIPVWMERTVVRYDDRKEAKRMERWRRIAKEAAEQAHRDRIPVVEPPVPFHACISRLSLYDLAILPYEKEATRGLRHLLQEVSDHLSLQNVCVVIGPEGGFSEQEVALAEQHGARTVTLGPRVLRAETAGLVVTAAILYHTGELGG